jgi:hypothetical protein
MIGILNVGAGDTKLVFDKDNPMERARSGRIVADMLKRGYVLFIDTGGKNYQRVLQFREDVCEYVIADMDPIVAERHDQEEGRSDESIRQTPSTARSEETGETPRRKAGRPRKSVPAESTTGVAVHRSAGG